MESENASSSCRAALWSFLSSVTRALVGQGVSVQFEFSAERVQFRRCVVAARGERGLAGIAGTPLASGLKTRNSPIMIRTALAALTKPGEGCGKTF